MKLFKKAFAFIFLTICQLGYSQGGAFSCAELQANFEKYQSCATNIPFQNSTGNPSRENFQTTCIQEPFRGPTWFFMKIQNSGSIQLLISQVDDFGLSSDVDFVLWGPFNDMTNICSQLNRSKEVDCSWLPDSQETVRINNAISGEYYILLVDNYSNTPGQITITQTGGTGSSDCSFLSSVEIKDTAGNEISQLDYCEPATKDLVATIDTRDFSGNVTNLRFNYKWYKDNVLISDISNSLSNTNTITATQTGNYKVEITAYDSTDPTINLSDLQVSTDEISLRFEKAPVLNTALVSLVQCDYIAPNNDGFAVTNLTQAYLELTNNDTTIALKYYTDSALTQQVTDPERFTNTTAFYQEVYVVGTYSTAPFACYSNIGKIGITINATSISNYPNPAPACPEVNTNFGKINLDAQRTIIKNLYFPTSSVTITFYANPTDASIKLNELANDNQFPVGISAVYARVESGNICQGIGTFNVEIYAAPVRNPITATNVCQNENVLLSSKDSEVLTGQNASVQASYFASFDDANNNRNQINKNTKLNLTVGTTPIFTRLLDTSTSCFSIVSFDLIVFANPTIATPDAITLCGDTTANFDLTVRNSQIANNNTAYQVFYYETLADMNNDVKISDFTSYSSSSKTIFVKVIDPTNNGCFVTTTLKLSVVSVPGSTSNPQNLQKCDDSGYHEFDLTLRENEMSGTTPVSQIEFRYYINITDAANNSPNFIASPDAFKNTIVSYQKIYVRINSKVNIDSETRIACHRILELELFVRPYPPNNLKKTSYKICVDINNNLVSPAFINTELIEGEYVFEWYRGSNAITGNEISGETASSISISTAGNYSVKITNLSTPARCQTIANFKVETTVIPFSITADPSEQIAFETKASVTAIVTPISADFQYMIDDSGWQSSNVFNNISEGIHILKVRNKFGCGEISTRLTVVDFPKFFTPNNDGYNDIWNVGGRTSLDISYVYIFDRYGKLIKTITQNSEGWDGTFNGEPLPADDYWFKIIFKKNGIDNEFKGHFSLKR